MGDRSFLKQDYLPRHLEPHLIENGLHGSIAVQARQSSRETEFLIELKNKYRFIKGVVGWIDLQSNSLDKQLESMSDQVVGFRHQLEDEPNLDYMNSGAFQAGIAKLAKYDYTYDLLVRPEHLTEAVKLVDRFPTQRFVIDHLAKPNFNNDSSDWRRHISALAERENVYCKLSGLVTELEIEVPDDQISIEPLLPFIEFSLEAFSASRVMYGSDWPVCTLAATYDEVIDITTTAIDPLSTSEQQAIMGATATEFYGLDIL